MALYRWDTKVAGIAKSFNPENVGTTGQVLTRTATWYEWENSTGLVTSVNGQTWAVTVSEFNPWGTATTWYVVKKTADWYEWAAESWAVTSVNWQTWAVTVSEFSPSNAGSTNQVLTRTATWYEWATPSWWIGISTDANNILTSWASIWVGTEANYTALATKSNNCIYLTI